MHIVSRKDLVCGIDLSLVTVAVPVKLSGNIELGVSLAAFTWGNIVKFSRKTKKKISDRSRQKVCNKPLSDKYRKSK